MKKITIIALFLLIAFFSSIIFSCDLKPGGTTTENDTIVANVYQFAKQASVTTEESAKTLMQLMELKALPDFSGKNENKLYYTVPEDASVFFEQELSTGNLTFSKSMKEYYGAFVPKLPQPAEAERIAREYLKKYQLVPSDNSEMKLVHQGGLRATSVVGGNRPGR